MSPAPNLPAAAVHTAPANTAPANTAPLHTAPVHTVPLAHALRSMLRHPLAVLADWNWKAGVVSALIHGGIFFTVNLRSGGSAALRAMLVEAVYSTFAAGLAGTVTQRLRHAVPRAQTAVVVWVVLPAALLLGRLAVHAALGTAHLRSGMLASFVFAALASGFNWYSMQQGAFVTGQNRSFARDLLLVPRLLYGFLTLPFRSLRWKEKAAAPFPVQPPPSSTQRGT